MMVLSIREKERLLSTMGLEQQQTTLYGSKGHRSLYSLESPPPAAHISYKPGMVVTKKLTHGMSRDEIIASAELAVFEKRKN